MTVDLDYSADQRATWRQLFRRQTAALRHRAHPTWFDGLASFGFDEEIPQLDELSRRIEDRVGWRIAAVNGQIDGLTFNTLLRDRTLPATTYIRSLAELAHSKEPDMFHDMIGHLPWLIDPDYRGFLAEFGAAALSLISDPVANGRLGLAFKWTVEYGLIRHGSALRAFGAGLMSSGGELDHALGEDVRRLPFRPALAEDTCHAPAQLQPQYFVIDGFAALRSGLDEMVRCAVSPRG
jgi:phenylalanine-4-hydroxylase